MNTNHPTKYYSILDTMNTLCVGRTTIYKLMAEGDLKTVKVGARRLVPAESIVAYQEKLNRLFAA